MFACEAESWRESAACTEVHRRDRYRTVQVWRVRFWSLPVKEKKTKNITLPPPPWPRSSPCSPSSPQHHGTAAPIPPPPSGCLPSSFILLPSSVLPVFLLPQVQASYSDNRSIVTLTFARLTLPLALFASPATTLLLSDDFFNARQQPSRTTASHSALELSSDSRRHRCADPTGHFLPRPLAPANLKHALGYRA